MNSKNLHKHSLPLVLLGSGFVLILGLMALRIGDINGGVSRDLTARVVQVKSTGRSLTQITFTIPDHASPHLDQAGLTATEYFNNR